MNDFNNLLFLPLDISPPGMEVIAGTIGELDKIEYSEMYRDDYRNCYHINLCKSDLHPGKYSKNFSPLLKWYEEKISPWAKGRIMIIVTPPNVENNLHVDYAPEKHFANCQHKLRFVIQGQTSSLIFQDKNKEIQATETNLPFVMSGKWPHKMNNNSQKRKYTFALGYPWEPDLDSDTEYIELLKKSYSKFKDKAIFEDISKLDDTPLKLFEKKYLGGEIPSWHRQV
jgi:hypothetical protein